MTNVDLRDKPRMSHAQNSKSTVIWSKRNLLTYLGLLPHRQHTASTSDYVQSCSAPFCLGVSEACVPWFSVLSLPQWVPGQSLPGYVAGWLPEGVANKNPLSWYLVPQMARNSKKCTEIQRCIEAYHEPHFIMICTDGSFTRSRSGQKLSGG